MQKYLHTNDLKRVTTTVRPVLNDPTKITRKDYATNQIGRNEDGLYSDSFCDAYDEIHVDEKKGSTSHRL